MSDTRKPKRAKKRRMLIDVIVPNAGSFRSTFRADSTTVSDEVLDAWIPVCEQINALAMAHFGKKRPSRGTAEPETTNG